MEYLFPLVALFWLVQFGLAHWQLQRFHRRIAALRRAGRCAVGMQGNRWRGRTYVVLAVDQQQIVRHAEVFDGWTVLARLRAVPSLEGRPLVSLAAGGTGAAELPAAQRAAFAHAAGFLLETPAAALERR